MRTTTTRTAVKDSFFDLVRKLPLRPIRSEEELDRAVETVRTLTMSKPDTEMDTGERDYLETLSVLIQRYERAQRHSALPDLSPLDRLKFLVAETGMTVNQLGRVIGSQPNASLILHGKRAMSKAQILKLAKHFAVSPSLFI